MFFAILTTLLALFGVLFSWSAITLRGNVAKAKTTGLPLLVRWIDLTNPLWMMFGSSIVLKARAWGIGTKHFRRFYLFGWEANERHAIHAELGPAFMLVSPGHNYLCVSDPDVIADVIHRRTDFRRNMEQFAVVNVYGKNLSTVDDDEWKKHRKITAITFTEKNNELVWRQSLAQARGMLDYWLQQPSVSTIADDTKVFTLNVLAAAIFNKPYAFQSATGSKNNTGPRDDSSLYRDSLGQILAYIIPIFICGEHGLQSWWAPKSWKSAGKAIATFRDYVSGLIREERDNLGQGLQKNQHLVAALVRASETEMHEHGDSVPGRKNMTLTEEEIISNLFVYAFAGNDTTAISLAHLLVDLAAHPEAQEWIAEELRHYLPDEDASKWDYKVYPQLKRCLAAMMESLRLNHPLGQIAKETGVYAQPLRIGSRDIIIPPGTSIHLNTVALHTDPQYWGEDAMQWNPRRFITVPEGAVPDFENEILASDTQSRFLPWATGQRVCPGKKFSQVEVVAVLALLLRSYIVQPQRRAGETMADARRRVFKTGMEVDHEGHILHEIRNPGLIALTWTRRRTTG
ncbi:hypothetical protein EKO04_005117 [Ascochyta lentis]|uniref:Cytochrome P450 n=1 Tax=Ascochyta lentis TaxID=205686 RepID=A0A8H7ME81_9PLEO|nr:hypothetical protein EKO04_005117 [Ascochyta lentis]